MADREHVVNFSAGPCHLPTAVLETVQEELLSYKGSGMSVLELSHRGDLWVERMAEIDALLRRALSVPDGYEVLFSTGGATQQFAMAPLNLAGQGQTVDFIATGRWSDKAIAEAEKLGRPTHLAASSKDTGYDRIPTDFDFSDAPAYVHYTSNNTVHGGEFHHVPDVGDHTLVCDASSNILSKPLDVAAHGLIYAGAQKNLGPAGVTLVIVRQDLLQRASWPLPTLLSYKTLADKGSMYNTPPVFAIHILGLVVDWVLSQGGAPIMAERARARAELIYGAIDGHDLYHGCVQPEARSRMNITFRLADPDLEPRFIKEATAREFFFTRGHRSVGGVRVSCYNAMELTAVERYVAFMEEFAAGV